MQVLKWRFKGTPTIYTGQKMPLIMAIGWTKMMNKLYPDIEHWHEPALQKT